MRTTLGLVCLLGALALVQCGHPWPRVRAGSPGQQHGEWHDGQYSGHGDEHSSDMYHGHDGENSDPQQITMQGQEESAPLQCRDMALKDGLINQRLDQLKRYGEKLTIMCVGECGTGKSSLISNIFTVPVKPSRGEPTTKITEQVLKMECEDIPLQITFIDTPGYGDDLALSKGFRKISQYIDDRFMRALKREEQEGRYVRNADADGMDGLVDVVLYFIAPHRFKGMDIQFLRHIQGRASIIPILAKADTMTQDELAEFKEEVSNRLKRERIHIYKGPFAVINGMTRTISEEDLGGRTYPWGRAESENECHSDLPALRRCLITEGLCELRRSGYVHYAKFRQRALAWHKGWRGWLRHSFWFVANHAALGYLYKVRPDWFKEGQEWVEKNAQKVADAPAVRSVVEGVKTGTSKTKDAISGALGGGGGKNRRRGGW